MTSGGMVGHMSKVRVFDAAACLMQWGGNCVKIGAA